MKIYTEEEIKKKQNRTYRILKTLRIIFMPIILLIVLLAGYIAYQRFYLKLPNVEFFGYKVYIVLTESMKGTIEAGDLIVVKETPKKEIKEKDIITFSLKDSKTTVTHRIVKIIKQDNGEIGYITKGDNNNAEDIEIIEYDQIQGVVKKNISSVGFIISELLTGTGLIVMIVIVILSYVHSSHKEDRRLAREYARKHFNFCKYKKN